MEGLVHDFLLREASQVLDQCDLLVVATGAGMSADSGLAVYKDVAKAPVYEALGMTYGDLCDPRLADSRPELFLGFWGGCFNAYRAATPHAGYAILRRWLESKGSAHPSFLVTANVDAHSARSGLAHPLRLHEIHGNTEAWQCGSRGCSNEAVYLAPPSYRFKVDPETLEAAALQAEDVEGLEREAFVPPELSRWYAEERACFEAFNGDFPRCPACREVLRPAVLMFDDWNWIPNTHQQERFRQWRDHSLPSFLRKRPQPHDSVLCVLEIGAGLRVPSIRNLCERLVADLRRENRTAKRVVLIRINPEETDVPSSIDSIVVPMKALEALRTLDSLMFVVE